MYDRLVGERPLYNDLLSLMFHDGISLQGVSHWNKCRRRKRQGEQE